MEKAVRSQPVAVKSEKPAAVKAEKVVKTEVKPEPEKEEKQEKLVKEESQEEKEEEHNTGELKVPTPVSDFQGSSADKKRNKIQQKLWEALGACTVQGEHFLRCSLKLRWYRVLDCSCPD